MFAHNFINVPGISSAVVPQAPPLVSVPSVPGDVLTCASPFRSDVSSDSKMSNNQVHLLSSAKLSHA